MNQSILEQKKAEAARIEDALHAAQSVVVVTYHNLDVKTINGLRKSLKENGGKFEVAKNTIMRRALDEDSVGDLDSLLKGPNAIITGSEETKILPIILKFVKKNKDMEIKGGVIGGVYCDPDKIKALSGVKDKEAALSMLVGALSAPVTQFACALKAYADSLPKQAA